MILNAKTKLSQEVYTSQGQTFTLTEYNNETELMITWANGEEALEYPIRITNRDAAELVELFAAVN